MRLLFVDLSNIKKLAKFEIEKGIGKLKTWWSKKYKLPANHNLFMDQSIGALYLEMYSDIYIKRDEIMSEITENSDLSLKQIAVLNRQLDEINSQLGEPYESSDELIDQWEKELEEGKIPDLTRHA